MATNSLSNLFRPQYRGSGIDFMAFARGAAAGRDANWVDELRANQRIEMDAKRGDTLRRIQDQEWDREAQRFTSTMMRNRQLAADAGLSPTDYLITQREQLLGDPNFTAMQPEVQQRVLNQIGMAARTHMEELTNTGRLQDALRVGQAFGMTPAPTETHVAGQTGESERILDSVNRRFGTNYAVDDEGLVDVNGINIPLNLVVQHIQSTGDAANLPALAAQWQAQEQARLAQEAADAEVKSIVDSLSGDGRDPAGSPAVMIDPETGLPVSSLSGTDTPTDTGVQPQGVSGGGLSSTTPSAPVTVTASPPAPATRSEDLTINDISIRSLPTPSGFIPPEGLTPTAAEPVGQEALQELVELLDKNVKSGAPMNAQDWAWVMGLIELATKQTKAQNEVSRIRRLLLGGS